MRRTIEASDNPAVVRGMVTRNNGRYNGNGREWATPPELFDPLHAEFGFTLDVCASIYNAKLPRYFTEAENGLDRDWRGERCWMNPPYGREIYPWTRKARESACSQLLQTSHGGMRTSSGTLRRSAGCAGACGSLPAGRIEHPGFSRRALLYGGDVQAARTLTEALSDGCQ